MKRISALCVVIFAFTACGSDDDYDVNEPVEQQEPVLQELEDGGTFVFTSSETGITVECRKFSDGTECWVVEYP